MGDIKVDESVAQSVFGYRLVVGDTKKENNERFDRWVPPTASDPEFAAHASEEKARLWLPALPRYSWDLVAAWLVVGRMRKTHGFKLESTAEGWLAIFTTDEGVHLGKGKTVAMAVCRAALDAAGGA